MRGNCGSARADLRPCAGPRGRSRARAVPGERVGADGQFLPFWQVFGPRAVQFLPFWQVFGVGGRGSCHFGRSWRVLGAVAPKRFPWGGKRPGAKGGGCRRAVSAQDICRTDRRRSARPLRIRCPRPSRELPDAGRARTSYEIMRTRVRSDILSSSWWMIFSSPTSGSALSPRHAAMPSASVLARLRSCRS